MKIPVGHPFVMESPVGHSFTHDNIIPIWALIQIWDPGWACPTVSHESQLGSHLIWDPSWDLPCLKS